MDFGSIYTTYILPTASLVVSILALLQAHRAARKSHRHWFPAAVRATPPSDGSPEEERFVEHSRVIAMATGVLAGAVGASAITLALVRVGVDAPIIGTVLSVGLVLEVALLGLLSARMRGPVAPTPPSG